MLRNVNMQGGGFILRILVENQGSFYSTSLMLITFNASAFWPYYICHFKKINEDT